ncbi:MAG: hypothetical protein PHW04_02095 [Candidatus Wallbacteria bacterium]|nr:hypothetical protein [Candidatus Wallbacteria bacterium]
MRTAFIFVFFCISAYAMPAALLDQANLQNGPYYLDGTDMFLTEAAQFFQLHGKEDLSLLQHKPIKTQIGGKEQFWSMNISTKQFEKINATLRAVTAHAYIYVEEGQTVSDQTITRFSSEFDNNIYPNDHKYYGSEWNPGIDFDERVTMFFLDIKDGYDPQTSPGFVAGYYFPMNEYSTKTFEYSNEREMLYIDTNPATPSSKMTYSVIAHEFQHMIHWNVDPREEVWLNESCAQLAMKTCGYEHPNQIFAYILNPKLSLPAWDKKVMLENYGAVYLWNYYLASKFSSPDYENFTLKLVANQKHGLDSVSDTLAQIGVTEDLTKIFADWAVANIINSRGSDYGYDSTMGMKLHPTKTYVADTGDWVSDKVLKFSADYLQFSYNVPFLPLFPTLIDKITVRSDKAGVVVWGVNGWQTPISEYLPPDSTLDDGRIKTALKSRSGKFEADLGPFKILSKQEVKQLNFVFRYEDGTLSQEYTVPVTSIDMTKENQNTLKLSFDGSSWFFSKTFQLYLVKFDSRNLESTLKIDKLTLGSDNKLTVQVDDYGTLFDTVILIPINTTDSSSLSYKYKAELLTSPKSALHDVHVLKSLQARALEKLNHQDIDSYLQYLDRIEAVTAVAGERIFRESTKPETTQTQLKSDEQDTSHDNLGYLVSKKQEIIDGLTHLKIDPVYLEGQIKQMLQLLEINLHFPHIPFPNGLALRDYNEEAAKAYLAQLTQLGPQGVQASDLELLRRLTLGENFVEQSYDKSLLLAEDATLSLFRLILLFAHSTDIVSLALDGATNLPLIGPYAETIKFKLIEKITVLFQRVVSYGSQSLPSPYSSIVPIASDLMVKVFFKVMHIDPQGSPYEAGFMKELAVKTIGKYVLSSLPVIGYVPLTQNNVDLGVNLVNQKEFSLSQKDALAKVWEGDSSILGIMNKRVDGVLSTCDRDRQLSGIANAVSDVTAITSAIDPTVISKVLTIAGKVASGGFLVHAIGTSGCGYYKELPDFTVQAVNKSFFPDRECMPEKVKSPYLYKENSLAPLLASSAQTLISKYLDRLERVKNAAVKQDAAQMKLCLPSFLESDTDLNRAEESVTQILGSKIRQGQDSRAEEMLTEIQNQDLNRANFFAELIAQDYLAAHKYDNKEILNKLEQLAGIIKNAYQNFGSQLNSYFSGSVSTPPLIVVTQLSELREIEAGKSLELKLTLSNVGSDSTGNFKFDIYQPENLEISQSSWDLNLSQGEERDLTVRVNAKGDGYKGLTSIGYGVSGNCVPGSNGSIWIKVK